MSACARPAALLLRKAAHAVTKVLAMLGVVEGDAIGFPLQGLGGEGAEDTLSPYLDAFKDFRSEVFGLLLFSSSSTFSLFSLSVVILILFSHLFLFPIPHHFLSCFVKFFSLFFFFFFSSYPCFCFPFSVLLFLSFAFLFSPFPS